MHRRWSEVAVVFVAGLVVTSASVLGSVPSAAPAALLIATFVGAGLGARWWVVLPPDALAFASADPHATQVGDLTFTGGLLVLAYGVGRAVWARRQRVGTLEREAKEAAALAEERIAEAVTAERAAMAVELHDIVAHAVSAVVVLAQAGRRGSAEVARGSLVAIEETARTAMDELRRLLTVLDVRPSARRSRDSARLRDTALAAGIAALGELELWSGEHYNGGPVWPGPRWFSAVLIVGFGAALLVRRTRPEAMASAVFGLLALEGLLVGSTEAAAGPVLIVVAAFSATTYGARLRVLIPIIATYGVVFGLTDDLAQGAFDRVWVSGLAAVALGVGWRARRRQHQLGALEQAAAVRARKHEQRVADALTAERTTLARELHDIVSHAVSVIVIQAQVGVRAPDNAAEALVAIEKAARTAMAELRRLLVLLDPDGASGGVRPMASLRQIPDLLLGWRSAGLEVDFHAADIPPLAPAVDLAAYRIVQESLTNTARHAPGARVAISLNVVGDQLEVRTRDFAQPAPAGGGPGGTGRGLIGMRQRIQLVGGELLEIGRGTDGFIVHARLPLLAAQA